MEVNNDTITLTITKHLDLESASLKVIEERAKEKTTTYHSGGYGGYYNNKTYNMETDFRNVYFYEYSNIDSAPKFFSRISEFVKWAKEHGVLISTTMEHQLKTTPVNYCICRKGSSTIISRSTRYLLENALKNDSTVPTVPSTTTPRSEGSYPYCGYDEYYDEYYRDWD